MIDNDSLDRLLREHARSNRNSPFVSITKDKRVAWVFATSENTRDGYIYLITASRAIENTFNHKKALLPNGVFIPEQEWVVPVKVRSNEVGQSYEVKKV